MDIKKFKPVTKSQRHLIQLDLNDLEKKSLLKKAIHGIKTVSGRNNKGIITINHKGGGHKRRYRKINYKMPKSVTSIVIGLEHDPNRNAKIASLFDITNNDFYYMIAPKNLKKGDIIKAGFNAEPKLGHTLELGNIPIGSFIYNISTKPNSKAQISRAAGTYSEIKEKTLDNVNVKLSSGEYRTLDIKANATLGAVSNELSKLKNKGKAGRSRWLNIRPTVRGVAMNPVDHPHGGGEGKKSGKGRTPWGKPIHKGTKRTK